MKITRRNSGVRIENLIRNNYLFVFFLLRPSICVCKTTICAPMLLARDICLSSFNNENNDNNSESELAVVLPWSLRYSHPQSSSFRIFFYWYFVICAAYCAPVNYGNYSQTHTAVITFIYSFSSSFFLRSWFLFYGARALCGSLSSWIHDFMIYDYVISFPLEQCAYAVFHWTLDAEPFSSVHYIYNTQLLSSLSLLLSQSW